MLNVWKTDPENNTAYTWKKEKKLKVYFFTFQAIAL